MICGTCSFCSICLHYSLKTFDITCNLCLYNSGLLSASSLLHQIRQFSIFQKGLPGQLCYVAGLSKRNWKPYDDCLSWRQLQHIDMSLFRHFIPSPQKFQSLPKRNEAFRMCWAYARLQKFHQNLSIVIACAALLNPKTHSIWSMPLSSLWAKKKRKKVHVFEIPKRSRTRREEWRFRPMWAS